MKYPRDHHLTGRAETSRQDRASTSARRTLPRTRKHKQAAIDNRRFGQKGLGGPSTATTQTDATPTGARIRAEVGARLRRRLRMLSAELDRQLRPEHTAASGR